ncbi:MAG: TIGR03118 family protein [Candidatus Sulfotelmatobacter sp.]
MQRCRTALTLALGFALVFVSSAAVAQYKLTNLSSNQAGKAKNRDPLLVNAWGLAYGPGGPFWVSDEGTGWSTLYNDAGVNQGLEVVIPAASGSGPGSPTGIVYNGSQDFQVQGWAAIFLFATLDGTISGWAPQSNPTMAIIGVNNPGAVYTGLAITSNPSGNFLFAADTANNKVDVYDASFNWVKSFTDSTVPAGFAPFGIQDIGGLVYVAFASQSGGSGGYIDIFSESGEFLRRLAQGSPLNQPWGIAAAPGNFGPLSNALLVSNNIDKSGTINAFNGFSGQFVGAVKDSSGNKITIDQLWGIEFGGGWTNDGAKNELFFTAGPNNNVNGTFGKISLAQ